MLQSTLTNMKGGVKDVPDIWNLKVQFPKQSGAQGLK